MLALATLDCMVASVPTGLVTFLFTDVEGSTRLWEADADGMKLSLEASSSRQLALCETAAGRVGRAASLLDSVLDRMPVLPMQEVHKPSTLDAIAEALLAAGRHEVGGTLLGTSLATASVPEATIRPAHLEELRERATELLGEDHAEELFALGAELELDEALERGHAVRTARCQRLISRPAAPRSPESRPPGAGTTPRASPALRPPSPR